MQTISQGQKSGRGRTCKFQALPILALFVLLFMLLLQRCSPSKSEKRTESGGMWTLIPVFFTPLIPTTHHPPKSAPVNSAKSESPAVSAVGSPPVRSQADWSKIGSCLNYVQTASCLVSPPYWKTRMSASRFY